MVVIVLGRVRLILKIRIEEQQTVAADPIIDVAMACPVRRSF